MVEDEDHNKYIVEIERSYTQNFMHKACFNTSRLVVDSISGNQDYTTIKKVFHISLLYFSTEPMKKPIYHGKTIIHEVDTAHPMTMLIANQGLQMFQQKDVFPEYFFISIPLFNDVITLEIDEWLYVMKHTEVRSDFTSPYMKKVLERLTVLKLNEEDRNLYYQYLKETVHAQDILTEAEQKGVQKGLQKGIEIGTEMGKEKWERQKALETARALLKQGVETGIIEGVTGLSKSEIE